MEVLLEKKLGKDLGRQSRWSQDESRCCRE